MAGPSNAHREHQPAGHVRLLMLTAGVDDGPGQVHSDSSAPYAYAEDGSAYWLEPDEFGATSVVAVLGADPAGMPHGMLARRGDGSEVLVTVDGYRIELDGHGGVEVWDQTGRVRIPVTGFFYVKE